MHEDTVRTEQMHTKNIFLIGLGLVLAACICIGAGAAADTSLSAEDTAMVSELYAGQTFTVSGTTTGHRNDMVVVELSSVAGGFTPGSKDDPVFEDRYRIKTTRIGESGLWSVDIDTAGLQPGEYWVTVTVGQLSPVTSEHPVLIRENVPVPPAPTEIPTPGPTESPVPASPGFGIAALLGLGAVALLIRR